MRYTHWRPAKPQTSCARLEGCAKSPFVKPARGQEVQSILIASTITTLILCFGIANCDRSPAAIGWGTCAKFSSDSAQSGLYTATLFRYDPSFFENIDGAIELGRSFVTPEHQKHFMPLFQLGRASVHTWYATQQVRSCSAQ